MQQKKALVYAFLLTSFLVFVWWFSGGSVIYGMRQGPPPAAKATAFVLRNFQTGLAFIFNSLNNFLGR